jgi:hypothetical protein
LPRQLDRYRFGKVHDVRFEQSLRRLEDPRLGLKISLDTNWNLPATKRSYRSQS